MGASLIVKNFKKSKNGKENRPIFRGEFSYMKIYPKEYLRSVLDINMEFMKKNKLKGLILDIDNTLIDLDKFLSEDIVKWCEDLKQNGIKFCIVSNTNKVEKVKMVADRLNLQYYYFAKKPCKGGFVKAQKYLELEPESIGVVGDQIFTDVIGGNRMNMFSILVMPLDKRDIWATKIKRPLENFIIKCYVKNKGKK